MDQASQLRNIIKMNAQVQRPTARVITVTSGKGGVGKSNVSINLAVQLRRLGQRVIIFDADFGLANIEVMFGAIPRHNLGDLIYQGKNIREIITQGPMDIGFISGGSGIAGLTNLGRDYINYLIQNLAELDMLADVIIIDTGAGISDAVIEFLVASGEVLLVTTPEPTSITDSYSLLKALNRHVRFNREMTTIKVIANKVRSPEEGQQLYNKLNAVVSRYLKIPIRYLGHVPEDQQLVKAVMQQTPISIDNPNAKSARAFENLAMTLTNNASEGTFRKHGMTGFFANMVRGIKNREWQ
ncbi:MAG: MinD/ParA family protein [Lachnospiraceae bacterium]|nr:MinD/ParA family protein [Lachnospiraceae bacterium]MBR6486720.1 MinD/ParA family protein [Lachnospiraceae bacterium]